MLDGRGRTALGSGLQLLQSLTQGGSTRVAHMRRVPGGFAQGDPDMKELQVRREGTSRREDRFKNRAVRFAAADRDQDGFRGD